MVVAAEVKHPVDDGFAQVAALLGADDDVAELARSARGRGFVDREREDVCRPVDVPVLPVQLPHPVRGDDLYPDVTVADSGGEERSANGLTKLLRHVG